MFFCRGAYFRLPNYKLVSSLTCFTLSTRARRAMTIPTWFQLGTNLLRSCVTEAKLFCDLVSTYACFQYPKNFMISSNLFPCLNCFLFLLSFFLSILVKTVFLLGRYHNFLPYYPRLSIETFTVYLPGYNFTLWYNFTIYYKYKYATLDFSSTDQRVLHVFLMLGVYSSRDYI